MYEVLVIGGGQVGSYVAGELAGMGHRVVVLEKKERLGEMVCCTGIISQECLNYFNINHDLILRPLNKARLFLMVEYIQASRVRGICFKKGLIEPKGIILLKPSTTSKLILFFDLFFKVTTLTKLPTVVLGKVKYLTEK